MFVATYCFVPPFRKAKFCGVPSRAIVKVGCAVGRKRLRNTGLGHSNTAFLCINFRLCEQMRWICGVL
jgi:hypothetical protein